MAEHPAPNDRAIDSGVPLWPLPLAIALTLTVAVHLAWVLSLHAGHVPPCIPYLEGCTSISRAARHGLGNHLFRLLVLPCALLVGMHWWLAARWLRGEVARGAGEARVILLLGVMAAIALALYATFLGSEGTAYRFLRRYGVVVFFGTSYLAQLLFLRSARGQGRLGPRMARVMTAICIAMLALGVTNVVADATMADAVRQDRLENVLEWHLGVLLVAWYLAHAWVWRGSGYTLRLVRR
ncbi:MAG: hypothetical protein M3485_06255 [Pseudomonadota bacterium]|nr:hypothetical protein [Pseudomonadota bacterium]